MKDRITLCIVGAGSSYTPELIDGIITRSGAEIPIGSVRLVDIDSARLDVMAGLAGRMFKRAGSDIELQSSANLDDMLEGADYVITQIRVGGMKARYLDESIPLKYGIIGQETTGPGGMFKALRTIDPMLHIAHRVSEICPEAFILNYTNPSGIITEAVTKHSNAKIIGLCSGIPGIRRSLAEQLSKPYPDLQTYSVGLNHFGFVHRMVSGGCDVTSEAIEYLSQNSDASADNAGQGDMRLARLLNAVPIGYVNYYYQRYQAVEKAKAASQTRAQQIEIIERDVFAEAALAETTTKPKALAKRGGGGYADVTFDVLSAIYNNSGAEIAASVLNNGTVEDISDDAVIEVVCRMDARGASPMPVGEIPIAYRGLVQAIKAYETLTVAAAINKSKPLAIQALLTHPLVGDLDQAEVLITEMLEAHCLDFS